VRLTYFYWVFYHYFANGGYYGVGQMTFKRGCKLDTSEEVTALQELIAEDNGWDKVVISHWTELKGDKK